MSKPKLTPWFPADVKPARVGVYQKDFEDETEEYQYWNGKRWFYGDITPSETLQKFSREGNDTIPLARPWRGLTSPSKKS